jgi:DNA ligase-1
MSLPTPPLAPPAPVSVSAPSPSPSNMAKRRSRSGTWAASAATTAAALKRQLRQVVKAGGEGLVLHRAEALYLAGRSDDLLKYKPYLDAEARVIAHLAGHGKYTGLLGALVVETESGQRFRLGSGFSDQERRQPPAIGTWVTYRYRDVTASGLPRFASYLRVRTDQEPATTGPQPQ